jgi:23S rRNA (cytidine2498-2'-O)-methyltransferase
LGCEGEEGQDAQEVFDKLRAAAGTPKSIFIRHLLPVHFGFEVEGSVEDVAHKVAEFCALGRHAAFSVQVRTIETPDQKLGRGELAKAIEALAQAAGSTLQRKNPSVICSIVVLGSHVFGGIGSSAEMLSSWPGGEVRYRADSDQISRAEFKLLEALETFDVRVVPGQRTLDLGAAPGGWSRILASFGARVTSVDPAELDPRCEAIAEISHQRTTAQEFAYSNPDARFELIVNDMKADVQESARVMTDVSALLVPGGRAIMTIKLAHESPVLTMSTIMESLAVLAESYTILGIRQLFHNRSEVTVCLGTGAAPRG